MARGRRLECLTGNVYVCIVGYSSSSEADCFEKKEIVTELLSAMIPSTL